MIFGFVSVILSKLYSLACCSLKLQHSLRSLSLWTPSVPVGSHLQWLWDSLQGANKHKYMHAPTSSKRPFYRHFQILIFYLSLQWNRILGWNPFYHAENSVDIQARAYYNMVLCCMLAVLHHSTMFKASFQPWKHSVSASSSHLSPSVYTHSHPFFCTTQSS